MEVAGVEPSAIDSQDVDEWLVRYLASGGCTQNWVQISSADVKSLLVVLRSWSVLPTSLKVATQLMIEAGGGRAAW